MPCRGYRLWMFLCRSRLRTSQTPCCGSWISRLPSRLSKCPRSLALRVHRVLLLLSRSQRNSWWKCRPSCLLRASLLQIVDTPVPRGRDQGSLPGQSSTTSHSSGKRISERIMEQIVDFPEQTVEQIVDTSPGVCFGQESSSSAGPADEDFNWVFRTFLRGKKSARAAASPSARVPPHSSSWTPAAYEASSGSDVWVELHDDVKSKTYCWNRRTRLSSWLPPEGIKVVWVGMRDH